MSKALEPVAGVGRVVFELDRFELVDGERYELEGRWSGVRGRRFIRPTLTLLADGQPIRLLADLTHKPWAAEDGESWRAAFPSRLDTQDVAEAELHVAPDITVALEPPGHRSPPAQAAARRPITSSPRPAVAPEQADRAASGQAQARQEQRELRRRLDTAETEKARTAARLDELLGKLSQAIREREDAQSAHAQLEGELDTLRLQLSEIARERDEARQERAELAAAHASVRRDRDQALQASQAAGLTRDEALAGRGAAVTARAQAESARDEAMAVAAQAQTERDAALALRDHALADRDTALTAQEVALAARDEALAARNEALRERDAAQAALTEIHTERAAKASAAGAAMVMRRAIQTPPAFQPTPRILPRALAIIMLLTIAVALLIVLRVG